MTKTFYLFRHGLARLPGQDYGDEIFSAELVPEGIPPIERMGKFLAHEMIEACFTSPFRRCLQTAEILKQAGVREFKTEERLKEYGPDQEHNLHENFDQFMIRMHDVANFIRGLEAAKIALCTHGSVVACLARLLADREFTLDNLHEFPNPGEIKILTPRGVEYRDFRN